MLFNSRNLTAISSGAALMVASMRNFSSRLTAISAREQRRGSWIMFGSGSAFGSGGVSGLELMAAGIDDAAFATV
jgi:hypothetical protein